MIDLKAIRERAEKATKGPWYATDATDRSYTGLCEADHRDEEPSAPFTVTREPTKAGWDTDGGYGQYGICEHDAAFIAAAREDVPALLGLVDELTRALLDAEQELDPLRTLEQRVRDLGDGKTEETLLVDFVLADLDDIRSKRPSLVDAALTAAGLDTTEKRDAARLAVK